MRQTWQGDGLYRSALLVMLDWDCVAKRRRRYRVSSAVYNALEAMGTVATMATHGIVICACPEILDDTRFYVEALPPDGC